MAFDIFYVFMNTPAAQPVALWGRIKMNLTLNTRHAHKLLGNRFVCNQHITHGYDVTFSISMRRVHINLKAEAEFGPDFCSY